MSRNTASTAKQAPAAPTADTDLDASGLVTIQEMMDQLQMTMAGEYDKLKTQWSIYSKDKEEMDRIKARLQGVNVKETDRLKLNVGGTRFEIRQSCTKNNTYFRSLVSETFTEADKDGFFFIDRDPTCIPMIMSYLRNGTIAFNRFSDSELEGIREDAEFYMMNDLMSDIDAYRSKRRSGDGIAACSINASRPVTDGFNGIFFEINVSKKDFKLHSISFVAGERRKIVGEAYWREGSIDGQGNMRKIGVVEQQVEKGQMVTVTFSAIPLNPGMHTIGVYSVSCPTAVAVCPRREAQRQFPGFTVERTYHTTNQKGHFNQRAAEDEFDFCGELAVSQ